MTLFKKTIGDNVLLVQVYVDDIIFGSSNESLCREFEEVMKERFEMSMMGEMCFFLGLQVVQKPDGILIHQEKYIQEILVKYKMDDSSSELSPLTAQTCLTPDESGKSIDAHHYRSMIGSLMYLTASRPDIAFAVGYCSRYQSNLKESHEKDVKRIFRYLKGTPCLGLWYPKGGALIFMHILKVTMAVANSIGNRFLVDVSIWGVFSLVAEQETDHRFFIYWGG
ncbi:hypothetical protein QVD17_08622 [Tagetes erecta]|uniref:Reverse transcriptase Ty1/copia-type domain-containing protein n=1 Tax=Tagetes erecta TaxID=13708 RepID=A0AAD8KZ87_TARER|nr:hypothetical protein QVD17_08622 [Tagetes erecta]